MKEKIKGLLPYIIILIIVVIVRSFIVTPVRVNGTSMFPTLEAGDILILNKLDKNYERYDIVVLDSSVIGEAIIKRVYGLPGETIKIEEGILYVDGKQIEDEYNNVLNDPVYIDNDMKDVEEFTLEDDEYFVLGDNRWASNDSRSFGPVTENQIEGTATFRVYPFNEFGKTE